MTKPRRRFVLNYPRTANSAGLEQLFDSRYGPRMAIARRKPDPDGITTAPLAGTVGCHAMVRHARTCMCDAIGATNFWPYAPIRRAACLSVGSSCCRDCPPLDRHANAPARPCAAPVQVPAVGEVRAASNWSASSASAASGHVDRAIVRPRPSRPPVRVNMARAAARVKRS
jgi:hypothetical protein